ncbi:unnamed protein product [Prorocentrum cordatum]|uniref:C2H2-type domain-containing protein n=1 Tax=Prorocentrum cordatum TaxID=2364126 RepID=A0ABN9XTG1_9DINO|nr:unnamed protein product [Polarella glacialis]
MADVAALARLRGAGTWATPLNWTPLAKLLGPRSVDDAEWTISHQRALRSLLGGSHWTQARLCDEGKTGSDLCIVCRAERGTLWHRCFACDGHAVRRRDRCPPELLAAARLVRERGEAAGELFARGLVPCAQQCFSRSEALEAHHLVWHTRPEGGFFSGDVFVDRSAFDVEDDSLTRAGWAIVAFNDDREITGAAHGVVPLMQVPLQEARDGEDYAFKMLAQIGQGPLRVHCDCKGTVRCARDRAFAMREANVRRHLWSTWWSETGDQEVEVVKIKVRHAPAAPWKLRGHSILARPCDDEDTVLFCMQCGANAQVPRKGRGSLLGPCHGSEAAGLAEARWRLRGGLHPHPWRQRQKLGQPRALTAAERRIWRPVLAPDAGEEEQGTPRLSWRRLHIFDVARLHGFPSPAEAVAWERPAALDSEGSESDGMA